MPTKSPRYTLSVQREAAEQVVVHHRPIAQVARQLRCSPQSVKNWIDKHHQSPPPPASSLLSRKSLSAFLPIQVAPSSASPSGKIELVTKNGLILRFPLETSSEVLCGIIQQLESVPC
jgi:transposase-like protein